jgi:hypothetical protein
VELVIAVALLLYVVWRMNRKTRRDELAQGIDVYAAGNEAEHPLPNAHARPMSMSDYPIETGLDANDLTWWREG